MRKVVLDTSVFIDYSRTNEGVLFHLLQKVRDNEIKLFTSSVVIYEFWVGTSMKLQKNVKKAELLFQKVKAVDVSSEIARHAGEIARNDYSKGFDAIIAATALEEKAYLATLNTKHFENIPKLKLFKEGVLK